MRTKTKVFLALSILGAAAGITAVLFLRDVLTALWSGIIMGAGFGLFGFGVAKFAFSRWEEKDPEIMRINEVELNDERNVAIRRRAKAVSGDILQWLVMAGAWVTIIMGAKLWITLLLIGVFILKTAVELLFIAYYQRKM